MAFGLIAMSGLVLFRGPISHLVDVPAMAHLLPLFALSNMLERFGYVPERILVRDLRFRDVAIIRGLGELTFTATSLVLAPR